MACIFVPALARTTGWSEPVSTNIKYAQSKVTQEERSKGLTVWMTGLSGSGKTTIAVEVEAQLFRKYGLRNVYRLDGDNLRFGLNKDLGFSDKDRAENNRRAGEVARLFNDAGFIILGSLIAPFKAEREMVRSMHNNTRFIEVFVDAPLAVAEERDPKGLYKKARTGKIKGFTGIDAPYEVPEQSDLVLKTADESLQESANILIKRILKETGIRVEKQDL